MATRVARLALTLIIATVLTGCAARLTVAELKYNPGRFQDKTVAIEGVVTNSWSVPLVPFRLYSVDDGTGEVTVVSDEGRGRGSLSKGARVRVKGRVNEVATLGGKSIGLHIRETDIDFLR